MTFYSDSHPTAIKGHTCEDCGRRISPGEKYRRGFGADNGTAWTWKECAHCAAIVPLLFSHFDAGEGYARETFLDWEPELPHHLRLKALWRKQWKRADGSLYPVPHQVTKTDSYGFGRVVDVTPGIEATG